MYGAAIAEGFAIKLKCDIVELAYPPCRKEHPWLKMAQH
jgi:hypothetical protein